MKLEIYCAMCGKERSIEIPLTRESTSRTLHGIVESKDWIVQLNGDNFDIYCSKKCAE